MCRCVTYKWHGVSICIQKCLLCPGEPDVYPEVILSEFYAAKQKESND